jgi:hypothetical protein
MNALPAVLLVAGLFFSSQATAASSQLPQDVIDAVVNGCANNSNLMWATPGSANKLCPCFTGFTAGHTAEDDRWRGGTAAIRT